MNHFGKYIVFEEIDDLHFVPMFYSEDEFVGTWFYRNLSNDFSIVIPLIGKIIVERSADLFYSTLRHHEYYIKFNDGEEVKAHYNGMSITGDISFIELCCSHYGLKCDRSSRFVPYDYTSELKIVFSIDYSCNENSVDIYVPIEKLESYKVSDFVSDFSHILLICECAYSKIHVNLEREYNQSSFLEIQREYQMQIIVEFLRRSINSFVGMKGLYSKFDKLFKQTEKLEKKISKYQLS